MVHEGTAWFLYESDDQFLFVLCVWFRAPLFVVHPAVAYVG